MKDKMLALPETILLESTNHCNLRCEMCPQGHDMILTKGFLSVDLFTKTIDEIKAIYGYKPKIGMHMTGEPLMHKQFPEMVKYANDAGLYTMIHTNGYLLNKELAHKLVNAGISEITFSFEGEDPKRYSQIRIGSKHSLVSENIKYFLNMKKSTRVIIEVLKFQNIDDTINIKESFKKQYPGAEFNSYFASNWHGTLKDPGLNEKEILVKHPAICPSMVKNLIVSWDGKIHPCGKDFDNRLIIGDLNHETIVEHWNGKKRKELFEKMKHGEYKDLKLCRDCGAPYTVRTKVRTIENTEA
ncbi:MAG: radical SAM protein [Desulfobacula sp.]|jgi:radical SAM protein with 4Fe4S-binding SPASM domain|nr:radical SAM protein [Desulfobacula sp.]